MPSGSHVNHRLFFTDIRRKMLRAPQKLKRVVRSHLASETSLSIFFAGLSIVFIAALLCSRYLAHANLIQNGVSVRDIYAEHQLQIADPEQTEQSRYEARQLVSPVYRKQNGMDKLILDRTMAQLDNVETILNSKQSLDTKRQNLRTILSDKELVPENILNTLLKTHHWGLIDNTTLEVIQALVKQGLNSEDYRLRRTILIQEQLDHYQGLTSEELNVVEFLVGNKLRPTVFIDEDETRQAEDSAAAHVKPVWETYYKGDLIVKKGDRLSGLQHAALEKQGTLSGQNRWLACLGVIILTVSLLSIVWGYLHRFEHSSFFKPAYCALISIFMAGTVGFLVIGTDFWPGVAVELYPIAILPLVIGIFTHPRIAILTTMMVLLLCGLTLKIPLESLAVLVISSMVGIFVLARKLVPSDRNDLILAGVSVGLSSAVVILALHFIYGASNGIDTIALYQQMFFGFLVGVAAGVLTSGSLSIIEGWFRLVTPYTLLELGNHNKPILRRLQIEAPGTFHHSVMVANLSEAAAEAIGANSVLTRVGALYHDIGKIKRPLFFVENQAYFGVENPHNKLTPRLSKMVITAHPRDGIEMGKQLGLPKVLLRFMPEHHGTMVAGYFYNQAVIQEGEENVNKAQFRYPGPKPQSKETAIVMMADACESAVRALKNHTLSQVEERVDTIIKQRIDDDQFNECPLTFEDIHRIRDTFIRIFRGIQHNRIEYQQNVLDQLGKKNGGLPESPQPAPKTSPPISPVATNGSGNGNGNGNGNGSAPAPSPSMPIPMHPKTIHDLATMQALELEGVLDETAPVIIDTDECC